MTAGKMLYRPIALLGLLALAGPAYPGLRSAFRHRTSHTSSGISQRRRLHVNSLITEPGTIELEWGAAYSTTTGDFTLPSALKYTPQGDHLLWGRTEYSVSFDSLSSTTPLNSRVNRFSDRLTMAATCALVDGEHFDLAIAPQTSVFLREEDGWRVGATLLGRYDRGLHSGGFAFSWTGATTSSATNPAGTIDIGGGYGRKLRSSGVLNRVTPHANVVYERSTGMDGLVSVFEGVEYQINERMGLDLSAQHLAVTGGPVDHQLVFGLTVNSGKLRHWRR